MGQILSLLYKSQRASSKTIQEGRIISNELKGNLETGSTIIFCEEKSRKFDIFNFSQNKNEREKNLPLIFDKQKSNQDHSFPLIS